MDAARAPMATSDEQGNRRRHRAVVRHRVVVGGREYIVETTSSDQPRDEEDDLREFLNPSVPYVPQLNHLFSGRREGQQQHQAEETETNHSYKRARVPASSKAILGLKEVSAADTKTQAECAVCLQDFDAEETLRAMPCAHAFHQDCIFRWLRLNHVCPLCRHALPTQQPDEEEANYQPTSMPVPEAA